MGYSFILGGARSGKSRYAEERASMLAARAGWPVVYVATATATDHEMQQRIAVHQQNRPRGWFTVEEPLNVVHWLREGHAPAVVVLDCLSLLVNNWMYAGWDDGVIGQRGQELSEALEDYPYGLVVVSNEVGQGIVPEYPLARRYRDALGRLNQRVAGTAELVVWMVAGLPVDVRKCAPEC